MVMPVDEVEEQEKVDLAEIVQMLGRETERWREQLAVSIGRASELTGLKESQIRYFEELEALQPHKTTDQRGASRLYTIADLRRLFALSQLTRQNYRPSEAARIVRTNAPFVDGGVYRSVSEIINAESSVLTDGFFLSRVLTQVLLACQAELDQQAEQRQQAGPRIRGALVPLRSLPELSSPDLTQAELTRLGRAIASAVGDIFVVLDREELAAGAPSHDWPPPPRIGSDESFVMFYSREAWMLPHVDTLRYVRYVPQLPSSPAIVLLLDRDVPWGGIQLQPEATSHAETDSRAEVIDRLLKLAATLGDRFRTAAPPRSYRYRTDGMPLRHTHQDFATVLEVLCRAVFRDDDTATAVMLVPDRLRSPAKLSILAHHRYPEDLVPHARLDLTRGPQGLSGRAFFYRELFLTRDASSDPRIAYAVEERCECAMAIPLTLAWSPSTYGVLYLASERKGVGLSSLDAYLAWVLSTALTELLTRWWTTRIRMANDSYLHREMGDMVEWLDGLGPYGPSFQRAVDTLARRWEELSDLPGHRLRTSYLALVVFDIDKHTSKLQEREAEPLLLRAQRHVRAAISRIVRAPQTFWFKNDHTILLLELQAPDNTSGGRGAWTQEAALGEVNDTVRRIARQVSMVPLALEDEGKAPVTISVSAEAKLLSLQDFVDMASSQAEIQGRLHQIFDELRQKAGTSGEGSVNIRA